MILVSMREIFREAPKQRGMESKAVFNAQIDDTHYILGIPFRNSCSTFFLHRFESYNNIDWLAEVLEGG